MSNLRKVRNMKKERYDIAIQPDPADFEQALDQPKKKFQYDIKSATLPNSGQKNNSKKTSEVIQGLEKAQQIARIQEAKIRASPLQNKKNVALNMMRLQDKSFDIQRNIYNISIGDLAEKQGYLSSLQEEIKLLKSKIEDLEGDQNQRYHSRTITNNQQSEINSQNASRTIEQRRSFCGRIYNRKNTPNSKTVFKLSGKSGRSEHQASSYYKWQPQIQVSEFREDQINRRQASQQNYSDSKRNKSTSSYRVKQGNQKSSASNNLKSEQKIKSQSRNIEQIKSPQKIEIVQQPEQLKKIFIENVEWQITNINDDFRKKIIKKLQIPSQFPLQQPDITDTLQEYQRRSAQIYKLFGINIQKCKQKVIVRKFKNGVYYQMKPNKNIVWYFTGAFYFGDWDTDLPSQAEKNGFGFEYVPEKYYYLGQFKNGNRCGKGCIKIINDSSQFMAYDGEWLDGKPHGKGKLIDEKNNRYIGQFDQGQKTGRAIVLNRDGLYYQGEMKKGLKHGFGMEKLVNLDVYQGHFLDGKFEGQGIYKWSNGSIYEGQFVAGKRQGKGTWRSYNGDVFEGFYYNDVKHGWGKFTWKNGQIYEGQFSNDIRDGIGEYKHPKGKMGKYFWKNGHIDHRISDKTWNQTIEQGLLNVQGEKKELQQV